ncbi:hypothetical protein FRACYDRAFT_250019 [Fragilariopsis cylindrus CCMP1102]|uniref:Uncharacterized protein n=1 Tax=Fragilariopsis cylindrus CCMP1102 TaxID=635003 RepID=A0A1E7EQL9_9STRA|nr:hypothetical protein FRACYDRAFT_250019 [Fragilariopsis cylindrus CCMP1102]|eukprot:OEU08232.1 hypothetical protein FRACYDRAFT_250019 [Fragilariopsis cylindrus CCMP1102]
MIKIQLHLICLILLCSTQHLQFLLLVDSFVLYHPSSSSSPQSNVVVSSFPAPRLLSTAAAATTTTTTSSQLFAQQQDNDNDEEIYTPRTIRSSTEDDENSFMDDLTPPPVNFARNSILFSDNPSTKQRNNSALDVWKFTRTYIPAFITGAWPWRDIPTLDERPLAALYNAAFVRLPVVSVAIGYLYQKIYEKHDLIVDFGFGGPLFGNGPQAINPIIVIGVLILILL